MATYTAASVAYLDVKAKYDLTVDGDTLIIPAGSASWTTCLQVTKNIIIQGSTTVVKNSETSYTVTDGTIITDRETGASKKTSNVIYCNFSATGSGTPMIKGITFNGVGSAATGSGMLYIEGTHKGVRVTQCSFFKTTRYAFWKDGAIYGVMDHCSSEQDSGSEKIATHDPGYGGKTFGDGSFNDGPHFLNSDPKRADAFTYEDCQFVSYITGTMTPGEKHGSLDSTAGGRRVVRHCYLRNTVPGLHGSESGGRLRASRLVELYDCVLDLTGSGSANTGVQHRGGTGIYFRNTITADATFTRNWQPIANRQTSVWTVWPMANGTNALDSNDTEGDGTYNPAHSPHRFWPTSGTATNDVTADDSVHQTGAGWTVDQWRGYFVTNVTTGLPSQIASNTSDTLALVAHWGGVKNTFTNGNTFEIYNLARGSLDQPGLGLGNLISGNPPTTADGKWANVNTEPLYQWLNTKNGSAYTNFFTRDTDAPLLTIADNRDYFNENPSFAPCTNPALTITSGVGYGTHANRPHCSYTGGAQPQGVGQIPFVGYWETDTNKFFVATGTDTWTLYYEPYTYPHPLTGAALGKIISLSGPGLTFGNVIIGQMSSATLSVLNQGDTLLTVTSVSYPTGFIGLTTGFTVAAGATHDITVTFTPLLAQLYSGNITVDSDADSGTETIACSGTGVSSGGGGHGKGHKKGVLVRRA